MDRIHRVHHEPFRGLAADGLRVAAATGQVRQWGWAAVATFVATLHALGLVFQDFGFAAVGLLDVAVRDRLLSDKVIGGNLRTAYGCRTIFDRSNYEKEQFWNYISPYRSVNTVSCSTTHVATIINSREIVNAHFVSPFVRFLCRR